MHAVYLLDLDGLLVRTEELHFAAYRALCERRGLALEWDFTTYCLAAHYGQDVLREALRRAVPALFAGGDDWGALHREKSRLYLDRLRDGEVDLQPGAGELLARLAAAGAALAVVTNSSREQADLLRLRIAELGRIAHWVTREDYAEPKPKPDAYRCALARLGKAPDQAVGLEDTPRGVAALRAAGVAALLVSRIPYPPDPALVGVRAYPDLPALLGELLPASSGTA